MAKRLLICSGKGGAGKSTTAVCLARALTARGQRVLLIDCDAGLRTLDLLTGLGAEAVYTWLDAAESVCAPSDALLKTEDGRLGLMLPPPVDAPLPDETAFSAVLGAVEGDFDFCLLDAPAGLAGFVPTLCSVSNAAVAVATPDAVCVRAASALGALLFAHIPEQEVRLLLNRFDYFQLRAHECLSPDSAVTQSGMRLIGAIPDDPHLKRLAEGERPLVSTREAFARVAARLLGEDVEFKVKKVRC